MTVEPPSSRDDFDIAIVCALALEFDAALSVLDEIYDEHSGAGLGKSWTDRNMYVNGRIGQHNVVLVTLPQRMGKVSAAVVASDLRHSYCNVRLCLVVGICGGVPRVGDQDVLLGDVAISNSLVQYDFGREYSDGFMRKSGAKDDLAGLNREVAGIINMFENTEYKRDALRQKTAEFLRDLQQRKPKYAFPDAASDRLFQAEYRHKHQESPDCICKDNVKESDRVCEEARKGSCNELGCDESFLIVRRRVEERMAAAAGPENADDAVFDPLIYIGRIASGDKVIKSGVTRDAIAAKEEVIAFEMEGAGIWEHVPSLVVKGVCDYADSHKNKKWQDYAAATAASTAKAMLMLITPADKRDLPATTQKQLEWMVPFPPDPDFLDRPEISEWLHEKSQLQGGRVALVGLGGIGKSQLVIQFAHGIRRKSHVFWVNITTRATLEESYRAIAERLKLTKEGDSAEDIFRRVGSWLGDERNGRWTVMLDNFDDPSVLSDEDPRLLKALPQTSNGFTIITSRTIQGTEILTGSLKNVMSVYPMSDEAAVQLFKKKVYTECEHEEAEEVVRLLGHMPLAIAQAAAYINRRTPRVTAGRYARMFKESDEQRAALLGAEYQDLRRSHSSAESILSTWAVTFSQIQHERPSAIDLLSLLSFYNPQSIPEWTLNAWYNPDPEALPRVAVGDTVSSSLSSMLSSVSLGRRYLNRRLDSTDKLTDVWEPLLRPNSVKQAAKEKAAEPTKHSRLSLFGKGKSKDRKSSETGSITSKTSKVSGGLKQEFEDDFELLIGYCLVTATSKEGVFTMHPLVRYCTQGWLAQSESLDLWKSRFMLVMQQNIDHPLARNRTQQGLITHIAPLMHDQPTDMLSARLWVTLMFFLSNLLDESGTGRNTVWLLEKVVDVGDRLVGSGDLLTLICMDRLARQLQSNNEYDKAFTTWKELLKRANRDSNADHAIVQESRLAYARAVQKEDRLDEAEQVARDIYERRVRVLGPRNVDTFWSLANHANILAALGRCDEAFSMVIDILCSDWSTCTDLLCFEQTINLCVSVGIQMKKKMPAQEVEPLLRKLVEFAEAYPHEIDRWFLFNLHGVYHCCLAECLSEQGRLAEEVEVLKKGMEHMAKHAPMPPLQPPTLVQGMLDSKQEPREERLRLLDEVTRNLRDDEERDEDYYYSMLNLSRSMYLQGRVEEPFKLVDSLITHLKAHKAYGENHKVTRRVRGFRKDLLSMWESEKKLREEGQDVAQNEKESSEGGLGEDEKSGALSE